CRKDANDPLANYHCERVGPLGTSTQGGRVRYRGSLADPNELALMTCLALPLAFAFAERGPLRASAAGRRAAAGPRLPVLLTERAVADVGGSPGGTPGHAALLVA